MNSQVAYVFLLAAFAHTLQISALPMISRRSTTNEEHTIEVNEGDSFQLPECEASNIYPPAFHWLFNSVLDPQSPYDNFASNMMSPPIEHAAVTTFSIKYIHHAKPEHSGKYTCVADSPTKRVTRSYMVKVNKAASKKPVSKSPEAHPTKIYQWTDQIMQIQEQRMYVICRATQGKSELPPAITWKLGDRELTETDNIKIHTNGDLEVKSVPEEFHWSENDLQCIAKGKDGSEDSKSTWVYVTALEKD